MSAKRVKLCCGVLSCHKHAARREACLVTWANVTQRDDVDLVFVLGGGRSPWPVREGCLLHCPCPDDYDSLSMKTRWLCLWAISNYAFDFLFKCDDDTYVHVDRLLTCDAQGDYRGGEIPGHDYGHASGGAGYRLSRNAAIHVGAFLDGSASYEDWMVWKLLSRAGIRLQSDSRFHYNCDRPPAQDNDQITCHRCSEQRMREIHEGLYPSNAVPRPEN
jgi:Galactosyltransferase